MVVESNPTASKRDIIVVIVVGANEENYVCCYRDDHHDYDDFHPDSDCARTGVVSRVKIGALG